MSPKELRIWALILGGIAMLAVQYSIPTLWEADGYYHIRMAEAVRREGPVKKFHWARYSYFATNFADKDFLYHVLLIPFTAFSGFFPGAKAAAVFFAFLLFLAYFYVLKERAGGAWAPALWTFPAPWPSAGKCSRPCPPGPAAPLEGLRPFPERSQAWK